MSGSETVPLLPRCRPLLPLLPWPRGLWSLELRFESSPSSRSKLDSICVAKVWNNCCTPANCFLFNSSFFFKCSSTRVVFVCRTQPLKYFSRKIKSSCWFILPWTPPAQAFCLLFSIDSLELDLLRASSISRMRFSSWPSSAQACQISKMRSSCWLSAKEFITQRRWLFFASILSLSFFSKSLTASSNPLFFLYSELYCSQPCQQRTSGPLSLLPSMDEITCFALVALSSWAVLSFCWTDFIFASDSASLFLSATASHQRLIASPTIFVAPAEVDLNMESVTLLSRLS
mmetsp:Transcript_23228/g.41948  ORF Transcript_23228/g.41948 Transcript_23228/m.41948 type:complete len:288 (-) Transcript_23228:834-1697(-)